MSKEIAEQQQTAVSFAPRNMTELTSWAERIAKSGLVPKEFVNKPQDIIVAAQWGHELGLQPLQSLQNIAVINGRPTMWGDSVIGIVRASPVCEYIVESILPNGDAECRVKRRGEPEQIRTFSDNDAKTAGLLGKSGPWTQYPKRMKQMRARSWALRDVFTDVLRGMPIAEEVMDYNERDITPHPTTGTQHAQAAIAVVDAEDPARLELISELEKTANTDGVDAYAKLWGDLTKEQRKLVGSVEHERMKFIAETHDAEHTFEPGADE